MLSYSKFLITDSGGLQEEASYYKIPTLVCRKVTERPEGLGNFSLLCKNYNNMKKDFTKILELVPVGDSPYGDGNASDKISKILKEKYDIK